MADPALLDPAAFDSLTQIDPSFFDHNVLPNDDPFAFDDGADLDLDLDLDLDADLDLDFDFPIDDFIHLSPDHESLPIVTRDDPPSTIDPVQTSGVSSSSSPAISCNQTSDPLSPDSCNNSSATSAVADPDAKSEEERAALRLKRKKKSGDAISDPSPNPNPRGAKVRRSDDTNSSSVFSAGGEEDDKRKVRLMRNRESAQLSRQRKKHYVEELEDRVKALNSTITELNNKISFVMAENATLRQQLGGNGGCPPPPAAIYPPPPMHFPWIPGYAYRPQASHVPLVPIPRLKPQPPAAAPRVKKPERKKGESKTKKVASVSLLGLLFIMIIFGSVSPGINIRNGRSRDSVTGEAGVVKDGILGQSQGRVLTISGRTSSLNNTGKIGSCTAESGVKDKPGPDAPVFTQNSSESIPALLYVPRNGKHVKIDGNLIIHSVLASEKAMKEKTLRDNAKQSSGREGKETALAVAGNMASALTISQAGKEVGRHPNSYRSSAEHQRDAYGDFMKSTPADGPLQQWFREGLAGPILSSGMCTEVFQFEVSPSAAGPGGIVPVASIVNASTDNPQKSARRGKMRNRRILYPQPIPLSGSVVNDSKHVGGSSEDTPVRSMVVSVLADPREAGDGGEGVMSPKSLSRVFVVVLLDSVKYVTYSCVLPFMSSSSHLGDLL